jgi:hypothetical protein
MSMGSDNKSDDFEASAYNREVLLHYGNLDMVGRIQDQRAADPASL